jgi:NAD(P)-dependent dehydrogenase (short-subunit alcohol dehydrogenase family)
MRLNFDAGRNLAHAFVERMQKQKFGRIINITGGEEPFGLNAAMPPNGATSIWSKSLSRVVAKDGVTVTASLLALFIPNKSTNGCFHPSKNNRHGRKPRSQPDTLGMLKTLP